MRVLFFKCIPPTLPKIVTFSMGSLNYLCNFGIAEYKEILNATALAEKPELVSEKISVDYRARLSCTLENMVTK